jgi:hypothetical protein
MLGHLFFESHFNCLQVTEQKTRVLKFQQSSTSVEHLQGQLRQAEARIRNLEQQEPLTHLKVDMATISSLQAQLRVANDVAAQSRAAMATHTILQEESRSYQAKAERLQTLVEQTANAAAELADLKTTHCQWYATTRLSAWLILPVACVCVCVCVVCVCDEISAHIMPVMFCCVNATYCIDVFGWVVMAHSGWNPYPHCSSPPRRPTPWLQTPCHPRPRPRPLLPVPLLLLHQHPRHLPPPPRYRICWI